MIARFEDTRDLRLMGGYQQGSDPELDRAIQFVPRVYEVLRQGPQDPASGDAFQDMVRALAADAGQAAKQPARRPQPTPEAATLTSGGRRALGLSGCSSTPGSAHLRPAAYRNACWRLGNALGEPGQVLLPEMAEINDVTRVNRFERLVTTTCRP